VDGVPFESFGGVDGAEDEVVVFELGWPGEVGARGGRVEREVCKERVEAGCVGGGCYELGEIG
jgi:hypothetical protein